MAEAKRGGGCQRAVADTGCIIAVHRATSFIARVGRWRHIAQGQAQLILAAILHREATEHEDRVDRVCATGVADDPALVRQAIGVAKGGRVASGVEDDQTVVGRQFGQVRRQRLLIGHGDAIVVGVSRLIQDAIADRTVDHRLGDNRERGGAAATVVWFVAIGQRTGAKERRTLPQHQVGGRRTDGRIEETIGIQVARPLVLPAERGHRHRAAAVEGGTEHGIVVAVVEFVGERLHH